jgi:hypothetical protein
VWSQLVDKVNIGERELEMESRYDIMYCIKPDSHFPNCTFHMQPILFFLSPFIIENTNSLFYSRWI